MQRRHQETVVLISRIYSWRTCRREVEIFILLKGASPFSRLLDCIILSHMECILHWHEFCICSVISCSFLSKLRQWPNELKYNVLWDYNSAKHVCVCQSAWHWEDYSQTNAFMEIHPQRFLLKVGWPPQMEFFLAVFPKVNLLPPPHVFQLSAV